MMDANVTTHERELLCDGDYYAGFDAPTFERTIREIIAIDTATNTLVWK
jgi:hypothetical protein